MMPAADSTPPEDVHIRAVEKTLPGDRTGVARLRGRMISVMETSFVKLNELVPPPGKSKATATATDDMKVMEAAEELIRRLSRAQKIVAACDSLLSMPGASPPAPVVKP